MGPSGDILWVAVVVDYRDMRGRQLPGRWPTALPCYACPEARLPLIRRRRQSWPGNAVAPRFSVSPSPYSVLSRPDARVLSVVQLDARIKAVRRGVLLVQALPLLTCRRIALVIDRDRRIALVIDREPSMHHEEPLPLSLFRRPMIRSD